jgi:hypothetical protein
MRGRPKGRVKQAASGNYPADVLSMGRFDCSVSRKPKRQTTHWERSREPPVASVWGHTKRQDEYRRVTEVHAKAAPLQCTADYLPAFTRAFAVLSRTTSLGLKT